MAELDQQDSQDALNNGSDNNSLCDDQCDASMAEESTSNGVKKESEDATKDDKPLKEKSGGNRKGNRFHPYGKEKSASDKKGQSRNRVFISNIPYDMKWQAIKDLMREKGLWCGRV